MSNICSNNLFIGCYPYCGNIILPLIGKNTGVYTIEFKFKGTDNFIQSAVAFKENIIIENVFNETNLNVIRILDDKGDYYTVTKDGEDYSTFSFRTNYSKDWTQKINLDEFCCETTDLCGDCDVDFVNSLIC